MFGLRSEILVLLSRLNKKEDIKQCIGYINLIKKTLSSLILFLKDMCFISIMPYQKIFTETTANHNHILATIVYPSVVYNIGNDRLLLHHTSIMFDQILPKNFKYVV